MTTRDDLPFQPGSATPVVDDHRKPALLAWFLRLTGKDRECLARWQGRCLAPDQCDDCAGSPQPSQTNP
jgi:hypothetical protein